MNQWYYWTSGSLLVSSLQNYVNWWESLFLAYWQVPVLVSFSISIPQGFGLPLVQILFFCLVAFLFDRQYSMITKISEISTRKIQVSEVFKSQNPTNLKLSVYCDITTSWWAQITRTSLSRLDGPSNFLLIHWSSFNLVVRLLGLGGKSIKTKFNSSTKSRSQST